jgi:cytoskeletal protein RodZ
LDAQHMNDLGDHLRQAREARGVALKDIAARTKISVSALEALERNDFSRLPGGIFGRAFVRAYALEIGLDPEATVSDFRVHLEQIERAAQARRNVRPEVTADDREFLERQRRAIRLLRVGVAVLVLAAVGAAAWRLLPVFSHKRASAAPGPSRADRLPDPPASTVPPAPAIDAPPVPSGATAATDKLVVEFQVSSECWVSASSDGRNVFSRLVQPGSHLRVEADREIDLDVGNAAAMTWTINGQPAKPVGAAGAHKTVRVTREGLADLLK